MQKIKLIWDFKGTNAKKIAEHHVIHLKEYIAKQQLNLNITGIAVIHELYTMAFMVVNKDEMKPVRDALKPHRGQIYKEET